MSIAQDVQGRVQDLAAGIVNRCLPKSGELREWTISEIEQSLLGDMGRLARALIEARLEVDPVRVVEKPRCPGCGADAQAYALRHDRIPPDVRRLPPLPGGCFPSGRSEPPKVGTFRLWTARGVSPRAPLARTRSRESATFPRRSTAFPGRATCSRTCCR